MYKKIALLVVGLSLNIGLANESYEKADKALNEAYKETMKSLSVDEQKDLKTAQRQWIKDRDAQCKKDVQCLLGYTNNRVAELMLLNKNLSFEVKKLSDKSTDFIFNLYSCNKDEFTEVNVCDVIITTKNHINPTFSFIVNHVFFNNDINNSFIVNDYNFDKYNDIVFWTGNDGPYGSRTYSFYLYNKLLNQFEYNEDLSKISEESLALPKIENNMLDFYSKSGCCIHYTYKYAVENNIPILEEEIIESLSDDQEEIIKETYKIQGDERILILKERLPVTEEL